MGRSTRLRALAVHWLDGLLLVGVASAAVIAVNALFRRWLNEAAGIIASLGVHWILSLTFFAVVVLSWVMPRGVLSLTKALIPPWKVFLHCGVLCKTLLGTVICCLFLDLLGISPWHGRAFLLAILPIGAGLAVGVPLAWLLVGTERTEGKKRTGGRKRVSLDSTSGPDLLKWLRDDEPVRRLEENAVPGHADVSWRILQRLLEAGADLQHVAPSIAVIGPYGSGKSTVCALAQDIYRRHRQRPKGEPRLLFCRFAAWQYQTPEAAIGGLLEVASQRLLQEIDDCPLWRIPQQYVQAIAETAGRWSAFVEAFAGEGRPPRTVLGKLGDALLRLNSRLVVVVDDLDRIEAGLSNVANAVLHAVNQMQEVTNVQFLLCLSSAPETDFAKNLDLLKLTQYQELVPLFDAEWIIERLDQFDEAVLGRTPDRIIVPVRPARHGPLSPRVWRALLRDSGLHHWSEHMASLLPTPRAFKAALRDALALWKGGLAGEINWDDLVSACALKAGEPLVFSSLLRHRATLEQQEPIPWTLTTPDSGFEQEAGRLKEVIDRRINDAPAARREAVYGTIGRLFPRFAHASHMSEGSMPGNVGPEEQRLCFRPRAGMSYLERFTAGRLPESDVADQPTLRFIQAVEGGQNERTQEQFRQEYQPDSEQRMPRFLKLVQFAPRLSRESVLMFADIMFDAVARPGDYGHDMFVRLRILTSACPNCGDLTGWLDDKAARHGRRLPLAVADLFGTYEHSAEKSWPVLAEEVRRAILDEETPVLDLLKYTLEGPPHLNLGRLRWALAEHPKYDSFRTHLTTLLVRQAEEDGTRTLRCRVVTSVPATWQGNFPEEGRPMESRLDYQLNHGAAVAAYDMDVLLPALRRWREDGLSDPVAAMALEKIIEGFQDHGE